MVEEKDYKKLYEKYVKLYDSMTDALRDVEGRLLESDKKNSLLLMEKKQWETEKVIQKAIIEQAVNTSNTTSQTYLVENKELKEEIKRLRDENKSLIDKILASTKT